MNAKNLTTQEFKDQIFDFTNNKEWKYSGTKPAIVDFYADWCGPCKMLSPLLEELAGEYDGKVDIFKVDTEAEQELSNVFGIRSIPSMLFIPLEGQPMMQAGLLPKNTLVDIIEKDLLKETVVVEK